MKWNWNVNWVKDMKRPFGISTFFGCENLEQLDFVFIGRLTWKLFAFQMLWENIIKTFFLSSSYIIYKITKGKAIVLQNRSKELWILTFFMKVKPCPFGLRKFRLIQHLKSLHLIQHLYFFSKMSKNLQVSDQATLVNFFGNEIFFLKKKYKCGI